LRNSRTILVVEDSDDDFDAVTRVFRRELAIENPLHRCEDGKDALQFLSEGGNAGPGALPAVILLDLNLPGIDGRQVLDEVKRDERLRLIPVLVMTNSDAQRDVRDCYRMGANCYIRKSLDWPSFVRTMAQLKGFWFDTAILPEV
jgi:CheY-like chemotaxis protein